MLRGLLFFLRFGWSSEKRYIIYSLIAQLLNCTLPLVCVVLPKYILDELTGGQNAQKIMAYILILLGYTLFSTAVSHICKMKSFSLRIKVCRDFNLFMHKRLADADLVFMEDPHFIDLRERANKFLFGDMNGFSYLLDSALDIVGQTITLLGIAYIIFDLNPWLIFVFLLLILVNTKVDAWAANNEIKLGAEQVTMERRWSYFGQLFEDVRYGKEIRINNLSDWLLKHESNYGDQVLNFYSRRNSFVIRSGVIGAVLTFVQQGIAYAYAAVGYLQGSITVGDFTMYVGVMTTFASAMRRLLKNIVEIKAFNVYYDAVEEYLHIPDKLHNPDGVMVKDQPHTIEFRNVSFRYPGQEQDALHNINIQIHAGEKLAIVGENGAGKTTFIKLLCRLYMATEGEILLDGKNILEYDRDSYDELLSAVFQDYCIFSFSLRDNVVLGNKVRDVEVRAVLEDVGLHDFLKNHDLDTPLMRDFMEDGVLPSGGESQKIAVARAILRNTPIIVLDEPAASMDPRSESELYRCINGLTQNKIVLYISHRLASTKFCDNIVVFQSGQIAEYGKHEVLYQQNGLYRELYDLQAQYYQNNREPEDYE